MLNDKGNHELSIQAVRSTLPRTPILNLNKILGKCLIREYIDMLEIFHGIAKFLMFTCSLEFLAYAIYRSARQNKKRMTLGYPLD